MLRACQTQTLLIVELEAKRDQQFIILLLFKFVDAKNEKVFIAGIVKFYYQSNTIMYLI